MLSQMNQPNRPLAALLIITVLTLMMSLSGCGKKGPLTLPEQNKPYQE
jgi:predicted small lipoprotein YifL